MLTFHTIVWFGASKRRSTSKPPLAIQSIARLLEQHGLLYAITSLRLAIAPDSASAPALVASASMMSGRVEKVNERNFNVWKTPMERLKNRNKANLVRFVYSQFDTTTRTLQRTLYNEELFDQDSTTKTFVRFRRTTKTFVRFRRTCSSYLPDCIVVVHRQWMVVLRFGYHLISLLDF